MTSLSDTFPGRLRQSPEGYAWFLPGDIFQSAELSLPFSLSQRVEQAGVALGEFAASIRRFPDPQMLIYAYKCREATLSSRIEGTQTEIEEAFLAEEDIASERRDDWREIICYIEGLNRAVEGLERLPLCNRLLKDTHSCLLAHGRGRDKLPGEFRRSQNWIGGSRPGNAHFVPPACEYVAEAMSNLERFIQDDSVPLPHLVKLALIHAQFETIHPFLDGNGRMGRMLIPLYLLEKRLLEYPILYISGFFESHRTDYYFLLDASRQGREGIIRWIDFFLDGVYRTASAGIRTTEEIIAYRDKCVQETMPKLGRRAANGLKLLDHLFTVVVTNARTARTALNLTAPSTNTLLNRFVELELLQEITGYKRNRVFVFRHYLDLLQGQ